MATALDPRGQKEEALAQNPDKSGRVVLPIPDVSAKGKMALDARNAEFPPINPLRPPKYSLGSSTLRPPVVRQSVPYVVCAEEPRTGYPEWVTSTNTIGPHGGP